MQHLRSPIGQRRDALVRQYGWLVHSLAWRLARQLPTHVSVADLESAGIIGLLGAVDRFEQDAEGAFAAYARVRIRGAMIDELRQLDALPRRARRQIGRLTRIEAALRQRLQRTPTRDELASALGAPVEQVDALRMLAELGDMHRVRAPDSLTEVPDPGADPEARLACREWLGWALGQLDERERVIIRQSYLEGMRLKQIGAGLGLTESRVSQLRRQAMTHLRTLAARSGSGVAAA